MKIFIFVTIFLSSLNLYSSTSSNWERENFYGDLVSLVDFGYSYNENHNINLDLINYNISFDFILFGTTAAKISINNDDLIYSFITLNNYFKLFAINKDNKEGKVHIDHYLYDFLYVKTDLIKFNYSYDSKCQIYYPTITVGNELAYKYSRFSYGYDNSNISFVLGFDYIIDLYNLDENKFSIKLFYRLGGLAAVFG